MKSGTLYYPCELIADPSNDALGECPEKEILTVEIGRNVFRFQLGIEFFENGQPKKAMFVASKPGKETHQYHTDYGCTHTFKPWGAVDDYVEFSSNGKLKKALIPGEMGFNIPFEKGGCYKIGGGNGETLEFFENGMIKALAGINQELPVYNYQLVKFYYSGTKTEFHDNGMVAKGMLGRDATLMTTKGDYRKFGYQAELEFDGQGRVIVNY